jgi:hypothetical protein
MARWKMKEKKERYQEKDYLNNLDAYKKFEVDV